MLYTEKLGHLDRLVSVLKRSHEGKKACINVSCKLSDSVLVGNCVKQGDMCRLYLHCTLICFFLMTLKDGHMEFTSTIEQHVSYLYYLYLAYCPHLSYYYHNISVFVHLDLPQVHLVNVQEILN